ncbi:MAG: hypothetical protein R3343_08665 [Nitriliruptorales bacterium]|nr:hypothetical protein [Nitriliruptorales bacterium]
MSPAERDLVAFHAGYLALALAVLLVGPGSPGWRIAVLVGLYWLALPVLARARGRSWLLRLWGFGAVLSVWQVLPDWFLVEFGTLTFPRDGFPDIGPVTGYMVGLWLIPTVVVVAAGMAAEERGGRARGAVTAGLVGAVVYVAAEATFHLIPAWRAINVTTVGAVALYIVPAEVLLSVASYDMFLTLRERPAWTVLPATLLLTILYLGAALLSFLVVEWMLS